MNQPGGSRAGIRDFLVSRRARITPERAGLPGGSRRRVPDLRCEEVTVLAGVSTEWYTRLEKGHLGGVSEDVPHAVARAPRLDEDERPYLFDLARAARPAGRTPRRRKTVDLPPGVAVALPPRVAVGLPPRVQWLLDSMTLSAALVTDDRPDIVAAHRNDGVGRAPSTLPQAPCGGQGCCPPWVRRTWVRLARFATPSFR
ncbi:hypothetical protein [Streptomyces arenae]|uniref:hypothetical protein n=1 Tax=Streptomyces arenae TaxID=29301 RepID=UPI0031BA6B69